MSLLARAAEWPRCRWPYAHLPLATVVAFGLSCDLGHPQGDIQRHSHPDSNVHQGLAAHLSRRSQARGRWQARGRSPYSGRVHEADVLQPRRTGLTIAVYFGVFDQTATSRPGRGGPRQRGRHARPRRAAACSASLPEGQTENIP